MQFAGKKVLLGVSGGIAAYKAAEIVRLLVKAGAEVHVAMTAHAKEFITPLTLQTLSGNPVLTDTFDTASGADIKHTSLGDEADLVILAPATANLIAKLAHGLADDFLSTAMLVVRCPVILAPAMNVHMWEHPIVQGNLRRLRKELGYRMVDPVEGMLACGYEGKGKLAEPETIVAAGAEALHPPDLKGKRILLTAGPTREHLDPIRYLSNPSTGKMGIALAEAAARRGAEVTLVLGPTAESVAAGVRVVRVETADEMFDAASAAYRDCDALIASAAVADYKPTERRNQKVKKKGDDIHVTLTRTPDILQSLSKDKGRRLLVGFAAETQHLEEHAREKLRKKACDLIVANDVTEPGSGFGTETNRVLLVGEEKTESLPLLGKPELAHRILDQLVDLFAQKVGIKGGLERQRA